MTLSVPVVEVAVRNVDLGLTSVDSIFASERNEVWVAPEPIAEVRSPVAQISAEVEARRGTRAPARQLTERAGDSSVNRRADRRLRVQRSHCHRSA
jgi:hypothetical protein